MPQIFTVTTEFANREDAIAMRDLIEELGFTPILAYRNIDEGPRTPIRDTRLGKAVLQFMRQAPTKGYTIEDVAAHIEEHDFAATSANSALAMLTVQGDCVRIGRGVYRLA